MSIGDKNNKIRDNLKRFTIMIKTENVKILSK